MFFVALLIFIMLILIIYSAGQMSPSNYSISRQKKEIY